MDHRIRDRIVAEGQKLFDAKPAAINYAGEEPADQLLGDLTEHSHAFVIACIADRQVKAEIAWRLPYRLQQRLGTFRFEDLAQLSLEDIQAAMAAQPPLHRFPANMAANIYSAIRHIDEQYGGVASRVWANRPPSAEVVFRFLRFRGVGPKIATMATNLLATDLKVPLSDYYSVDIAADRHVKRVLGRLGLNSPTE